MKVICIVREYTVAYIYEASEKHKPKNPAENTITEDGSGTAFTDCNIGFMRKRDVLPEPRKV